MNYIIVDLINRKEIIVQHSIYGAIYNAKKIALSHPEYSIKVINKETGKVLWVYDGKN